MSELYQQIVAYLLATWRRRWYAIGIAWLVCGLGWTFTASMPDRYESSARIYADMDSMLGPLMRGLTVETNTVRQIDFIQRTLLSRPNLEKVLLLTDLDVSIRSNRHKEEVIERLRESIQVADQGRNLFTVHYSHPDPQLSRRVVQAVLQIFVEGNLGRNRTDMDTTQRFLADQIRDYERQLEEAEARRAEFKRANMGFLPGEGRDYYAQMQLVRAKVMATASQLAQARSVAVNLRKQLKNIPQFIEAPAGSGPPLSANFGDGPESDLTVRIMELDRVVDNLLTRYTEKHPDVVNARRRIAVLKGQLDEQNQVGEEDGPGANTPGTNRMSNPVYEQLKLQLAQQESVIAALSEKLRSENQEVKKWDGMAKLVPQVEARLTKLDRDYAIIKKGYEELRGRQEAARLARDLDTKAEKVKFRIIDPPKVPIVPTGPNREFFATAVLVIGIAAGIAFAFLLSQLNVTFSNAETLRRAFVLPVLGSISVIRSTADLRRNRRELLGFGMVSLSLFVAFAALLVVTSLNDGALAGHIQDIVKSSS